MKAFFEDVGEGDNAGIWEDVPPDQQAFRNKNTARRIKDAARKEKKTDKVEGAIGC